MTMAARPTSNKAPRTMLLKPTVTLVRFSPLLSCEVMKKRPLFGSVSCVFGVSAAAAAATRTAARTRNTVGEATECELF